MGLSQADSVLSRARRVGLFGGSFDPVHLAHLSLARIALQQLALDELRWLPAGQPWQKAGRAMAAPEHREAMVKLMMGDEPRFVLDRRELMRQGPSYTIDTVRQLHSGSGEQSVFLIIGQDQYARLHTWHEWRELLGSVHLAVAAREGEAVKMPEALAGFAHEVVKLEMPTMGVSSSAVRAAKARGEDIRSLVGEAVAGYIALHRLYEARQPDTQATTP